MSTQRISILIALDAADEALRRALEAARRRLAELGDTGQDAGARAGAGVADVGSGLDALGEQVQQAKTQFLAFVSIDLLVGQLQQVVQVVDAWNLMTARLKLATAGAREFTIAQQALFAIAQRTGVPLSETATLYGKLQQAVRMMGREQADALTLTETISQALRVSGVSASEAQSALLQFGQALPSGALRGDEFNSVVENSPRLAQALADGLSVPIGRLRVLAEEGRLTADIVVNALLSQKERLATEFAQMPQTAEAAFGRLQNAARQWINQFDAATDMTRKVTESLTWLAQNLDSVLQAIKRLAELGLAVLVYRLLPALVIAWETAGAAAVAAASASTAAWATANLSLAQAAASLGVLKTGFVVLGAFLVGWEIGTWLSAKFEIVRKAGIAMVQALMTGLEQMRFHWEAFAAIFTGDTLSAATQRHRSRLAEMNAIFSEMYAGASKGADAAKTAMNASAATAEEIAKRLDAVRQGTQEAVGRGVEAVHAALEKLKSRLGEVDQAVGKANQTVTDATAKMAEAYKGLTGLIEANLQQQVQAVKARYQAEQTELERSGQSEAARIAQSTQNLIAALAQQTTLRQQASADTLALIQTESQAQIEAAHRHGQTEAERQANVQRVENSILATRRQTLTQALGDYRQHIDALNTEANRHLSEIQRIEDAKRQLALSTAERIRELQRQGLSETEATEDRKRQIVELQTQARQALAQGEFEQARQLAQKAMDLAAQVGSSQANAAKQAGEARKQSEQAHSEVVKLESQAREARLKGENEQAEALLRQADALRNELAQKTQTADAAIAQGKGEVKRAIEGIREAEEILNQTLDAEAKAHQRAADSALSARDDIQQTLQNTRSEIDTLTAQLKEGLKLTLEADTSRFQQALGELDQSLAEKAHLLVIQADLEPAQKQLQEYEQLLKEGKTLPVDADVSQAQAALEQLKTYAEDHSQLSLKVDTEKAQAAISNVQGMIGALNRIETESRHQVSSNAGGVRAEVQSLNGMNTSSTHTVYVQKVETHAIGGVVGSAMPRVSVSGIQTAGASSTTAAPRYFAQGGAVSSAFPRMRSGTVPGSGHQDTVPRTLQAGAFVIRKAAVQRYGQSAFTRLNRLANQITQGGAKGGPLGITPGIARFASGGPVQPPFRGFSSITGLSTTPGKKNREVVETWAMIDLGLKGVDAQADYLQRHLGAMAHHNLRGNTLERYGKTAQQDRRVLKTLLHRKQLTSYERQTLDGIRQTWKLAMSLGLVWGTDLERSLMETMDSMEGEFFAGGGLARSDTVPAMLTPGEYVVNRDTVSRLGVGFFEAINRMVMPAKALAGRVRGFAGGGLVPLSAGLARTASKASNLVGSLPSVDLGTQLLASLTSTLRVPTPALASSLPATPSRTLRVELASGHQQVTATVDARDEARLLDLLAQAKTRSL